MYIVQYKITHIQYQAAPTAHMYYSKNRTTMAYNNITTYELIGENIALGQAKQSIKNQSIKIKREADSSDMHGKT